MDRKIAKIVCLSAIGETLAQDNYSNLYLLVTRALECVIGQFEVLCDVIASDLEAKPYEQLFARQGIAAGNSLTTRRARARSRSARAVHCRVSSSRHCSGVIEESAFAHNHGRQRGHYMCCPAFEVALQPGNDIGRRPDAR